MDRTTLKTLATALNGRCLYSDRKLMIFGFPSDEATLKFREMIPFATLWCSGEGIKEDVPPLNVYLDRLKEA